MIGAPSRRGRRDSRTSSPRARPSPCATRRIALRPPLHPGSSPRRTASEAPGLDAPEPTTYRPRRRGAPAPPADIWGSPSASSMLLTEHLDPRHGEALRTSADGRPETSATIAHDPASRRAPRAPRDRDGEVGARRRSPEAPVEVEEQPSGGRRTTMAPARRLASPGRAGRARPVPLTPCGSRSRPAPSFTCALNRFWRADEAM